MLKLFVKHWFLFKVIFSKIREKLFKNSQIYFSRDSIESVKYSVRNSGVSNHDDVENAVTVAGSDVASNSHTPTASLNHQNEDKRAHSQCKLRC